MNKKDLKTNANIVGVAPLNDSHFEELTQNKKSTKACPNLISNLQPLNSNFSTLTSHISPLTSGSRGITLIALVITIIVMLILVGVTVTVAIQGGLFNTAKDAARKTQLEADKESLLSAVIGAINDNAEVNFEGLNGNLPEGFEGNNKDGYTSKSGNTFFVDKYGNIDTVTIIEKEETTTDDYGKYVKYGVDLNGDGIYTNDWKVFYVDDQKRTFIIAADYVSGDKCDELQTAIGTDKAKMYKYGSDFNYCYRWTNLTDVVYHCNDGHNETLNNEKEQCSYPELFMADDYYCSDHVGEDGKSGDNKFRCASALLCSGNWESLVKEEDGASYAIGGPTIEMWVASWNQKYGVDKDDNGITLSTFTVDDTSAGHGYNVKDDKNDQIGLTLTSCVNGYNDTLYFPHDSTSFSLPDGSVGKCEGYWIASPYSVNISDLVTCESSGVLGHSHVSCLFQHPGLRPVVCLTSGVKLATNGEN